MKIVLFIALCFIGSCANRPNGWTPFVPRPMNMNIITNYPAGSDYQMGFNAGCQTFLGVAGGGVMRLTPANINGWYLTGKCDKSDPKCPKNAKLYSSGFSDGQEHCTYHYDWWVL